MTAPDWTGPRARLHVPFLRLLEQGREAHVMLCCGSTYAQVAEKLGCSKTTVWRRRRWWQDWTAMQVQGIPLSKQRVPPQRSTRFWPGGVELTNPWNNEDGIEKPRKPRRLQRSYPPPEPAMSWQQVYATYTCRCGVEVVLARPACPWCGAERSAPRES